MKSLKFLSLLSISAAILVGTRADAAIVVVHVFDMDFSVNPQGGPIVDPTINVGDTIRWQFDASLHTTTSVAGIPESWNSGSRNLGETFDHTFTQIGSWQYYCMNHGFDMGGGMAGGMSGVVTVVPEPASMIALGAGALVVLRRRRRRV
jgi:plastocyanin